jgi:hypothetical protein
MDYRVAGVSFKVIKALVKCCSPENVTTCLIFAAGDIPIDR